MIIPANWTPTPENVNTLPEPLRKYIHDLHTSCDPAGIMQHNFSLRQEVKALRYECARLAERVPEELQ